MVESLFGELTVLGFLGLLSFLVTKLGLLSGLSEHLFDEEDTLDEGTHQWRVVCLLVAHLLALLAHLLACSLACFACHTR